MERVRKAARLIRRPKGKEMRMPTEVLEPYIGVES